MAEAVPHPREIGAPQTDVPFRFQDGATPRRGVAGRDRQFLGGTGHELHQPQGPGLGGYRGIEDTLLTDHPIDPVLGQPRLPGLLLHQGPIGEGKAQFEVVPVVGAGQGKNRLVMPNQPSGQGGGGPQIGGLQVAGQGAPLPAHVRVPAQALEFPNPLQGGRGGEAAEALGLDGDRARLQGIGEPEPVRRQQAPEAALAGRSREARLGSLILAQGGLGAPLPVEPAITLLHLVGHAPHPLRYPPPIPLANGRPQAPLLGLQVFIMRRHPVPERQPPGAIDRGEGLAHRRMGAIPGQGVPFQGIGMGCQGEGGLLGRRPCEVDDANRQDRRRQGGWDRVGTRWGAGWGPVQGIGPGGGRGARLAVRPCRFRQGLQHPGRASQHRQPVVEPGPLRGRQPGAQVTGQLRLPGLQGQPDPRPEPFRGQAALGPPGLEEGIAGRRLGAGLQPEGLQPGGDEGPVRRPRLEQGTQVETASLHRVIPLPVDPRQIRPASGLGEALDIGRAQPLRQGGVPELGQEGLDGGIRRRLLITQFGESQVGIQRIVPELVPQGLEGGAVPALQSPLGPEEGGSVGRAVGILAPRGWQYRHGRYQQYP